MSEKNLPTGGTQAVSKIQQKDAGGSYGSSALINYKKQENFNMKTLKRIMAVLLLFITILAVSYVVYTVKQISPENTISEVLYEIAKTT